MIIFILGCVVGGGLGSLICYLVLRKGLHTTQKIDQETIQKNNQILQEYNDNKKRLDVSNECIKTVAAEEQRYSEKLELQKTHYEANKQLMKNSMQQLEENLSKNFEDRALELGKEYEVEKTKLTTLYLDLQAELTEQGQEKLEELYDQIRSASDCLTDLRSKEAAAVEANRRKEQMAQEQFYYRLQISPLDLQEINKIKEIAPYLKDATPLYKVIWKIYYEKAYTDLIGRVFGQEKNITGIYKITNVTNGRCYVGQAVDVAERWRQHIKRGLGADPPTKNKLYPAMKHIGPENFTFELLEECPRAKLNEREDYWQDFYQAKEFGYSIK